MLEVIFIKHIENEKCMDDKIVLGLSEKIIVFGSDEMTEELDARVDTGAVKSSIDQKLAAKLRLGPIIKNRRVKQSNGEVVRPVIEVEIELKGKRLKADFTISNRSHMTYRALLGQDILKQGFLIDPNK
jgi:hypothetical protein